MIQSNFIQGPRSFSLVLLCAMLGACSTMQKSSTGSGEQTAAPISEASNSSDGTKAAGSSTSKPSPSTAAAGTGSPPRPAGAAGATGATGGNSGTKQDSSDSGKSAAANEEEAQLKRQLADQDAQINKLRVEQEAEAASEEAEAAKMREQQVAAAGATGQESAAGAAPAPASNKGQEEAAVFPANASSAESGSTEAAVQRAAERSVYFGYNQSTVSEKYDEMLLANAAWLKAHPDVKAEVQGNCDERGSREYNLALGSRRAMAVKRALELAGAEGGRIAAISYGSEKPVATGKDEDSYSKNRRADIVY